MTTLSPAAGSTIVKGIIARHRAIVSPVFIRHLGHDFRLDPGVFSPFIAPSGRLGLSFASWPIFHGKRVLDIGCGAGIIASLIARSGAASVVATDVSVPALNNARANVDALRVDAVVDLRRGDLLEPIGQEEVFDIVFADLPFSDGEPGDDLERAFFDRDLACVRRFLRDMPSLLRRGGEATRAYLCLSNLEAFGLGPNPFVAYDLDTIAVCRIKCEGVDLVLYELGASAKG